MIETAEMPLTVYGLLARRHGTDANYVCKVVTGARKAVRGKAAAILEDWLKLKDNFDNWMSEFKADGTMIINMDDIRVSVYVQDGIARIYQRAEFMTETDVSTLNLDEFKDFLNGVRIEFN